MIATGTGLAPMISMLEALPEETSKLVIFGGRYEEDLYYLEKLRSFKNVELRTCVSRPSRDFTGEKGRVTDCIHDIAPDDEVYICGNPDMVHSVVTFLKENDHKVDKIYHEDFTLAAKPQTLWKSMMYDGNMPGVLTLERLLVVL